MLISYIAPKIVSPIGAYTTSIMEKGGYVYIVSNHDRKVLYIGVTDELRATIQRHKKGEELSNYSRHHHCTDLLHYEYFADMADVKLRAEQLKKWSRARKDELIQFNNPEWKDLGGDVLGKG